MTTAIYVRISRDVDDTRLGVRRQRKDCEALCAARKWAPTAVYEDNDVGAYSGRKRPAYERMVADIRSGLVDRVVVWNPDRLHRHPRELEDFIDLIEETGCAVATVTAGIYDLATGDGQAMARVIGAFNRKESADKSRRIRAKHAELAENGRLSGGGSRPFGYQRGGPSGLVIDKAEAVVVRDLVNRYIAGESATSLAADLRARQVPTVNGGVWRSNTVRNIVTNPLYSAQREHHGTIVAAGDWPPIVTVEQTAHASAVNVFRSGQRGAVRTASLLAGLVRCGRCDAPMHAGETIRGTPKLRCARPPLGCGKTVVVRTPLEELIVDTVIAVVDTAGYAAVAAKPDRSVRQADRVVADAEAQLAELSVAYADRIISMGEWKVARGRIQARIQQARADAGEAVVQDAALLPYRGKPGALIRAWPRIGDGQRHAIIAAIVETIVVGPAVRGRKTFDPGRVNIRWR